MKRIFAAVLCTVLFAGGTAAGQDQLIGARFPSLSPDAAQIAFSYMGDIWVVSSEGGEARRLTNHIAYEREPVWSSDGRSIAFTSNRTGNNDIFLIPVSGGEPEQITFHTGNDVATDFSPDGRWIYFTSGRTSSAGTWRIPVGGGNALPVLETHWSRPYDAKVHPGGDGILFSLGMENGSKWRRGYRGANSATIWYLGIGADEAQLLVQDESNSFWPAWGPSGDRMYFVSDREFGNSNIWSAARDGSDQKPVTRFRRNDIRWMQMAKNAAKAVYERDFGIWITDIENGRSEAVRIEAPNELKENRTVTLTDESISEFRVSPDGKKIAAVIRGEIFVLSTEGDYARNITNTAWRERDIAWNMESSRIIYVSDPEANPDLYSVSALGDSEPERLTRTSEDVLQPQLSPDGEWIAYYRGHRQIRLIRPDGSGDRLLIEDDFGGRFADGFSWSPDSRYVAVVRSGSNTDIYAVSVETGEKTMLTNTAYDEGSPVWSSDGKTLFFASNRSGHSFPEFTGQGDIYRLLLEPRAPEFDEDEFEALFAEEVEEDGEGEGKKADKGDVEVVLDLEDIDLQTERVARTLGNERFPIVSPKDPNTVYFVSNLTGRSHLWKSEFKDGRWGAYEAWVPQVSNPGNLHFDASGRYLYYTSGGRIGRIDTNNDRNSTISFSTRIEVDRTADYAQMLSEVYYVLEHYYYDSAHHDIDWKATYEHFLPVLQQVREDQDFYNYANEMIGYLNSSHTGIRAPGGGFSTPKPSAHLGCAFVFPGGKVTIGSILKNGPLYAHRDSISVGDEIVAIDDEPVSTNENIWLLLNGHVGRRLYVTVKSRRSGDEMRLTVRPISSGAERSLRQREWVESRREIVTRETGDQGAYIYMSAMGTGDLNRFLLELERDAVPREGLILDLRFNMGGNVHDRVLDALTRPVYAKWRQRGLSETPQSTFGFADRPIVLLINEVTLSDGEMTTSGFKALDRGTVVGNTTYGWLIFTTSARLLNGGSFRLPWWGCYTLEGEDLETSGGVTPDIMIINDLNHDLKGEDPQLMRAIQILREQMGGR